MSSSLKKENWVEQEVSDFIATVKVFHYTFVS